MIFQSPHPPVAIPELSLADFVLAHAERLGDKPALIDAVTGHTLSYRELLRGARAVAASLTARGFRKGDVLAVYSPNHLDYAHAFYGVVLAGGAITPVNPLFTAPELSTQLRDAGARCLVATPALAESALQAAEACGIRELYSFGDGAEGFTPFSELLDGGGESFPGVRVDPHSDICALPYSSGTTGLPKGVMLTHRNIISNIVHNDAAGAFRLIREDSTCVAVLPFFHIYGLVMLLSFTLYRGATLVTLPRFDLRTYLGALQNHRVEFAQLVPPLVLALARSPVVEQYDLSRLQCAISAAAPLGPELEEDLYRRLGCRVIQGYGLTESSPGTHIMPFPPTPGKSGSVGPLVPGMEARIMDVETGEFLGFGKEGEIHVRGPQVMKGYLNNPQATAENLDDEGWLRTGDIGYVDADGYFYVVDRLKELIKYKGHQVAPAELESLLLTHPGVLDAAVIGIPDEQAGEIPKAFVVPRDGFPATDDLMNEIMDYISARVSPISRVRRMEFIAEIPKSPSGKILRRILKEGQGISTKS